MIKSIIQSILDSDLYKLTMQQTVFHQYPNAKVKYIFKLRNDGVNLAFLRDAIVEELSNWDKLFLTSQEASFLRGLGFFQEDYIEYLAQYRFDPSLVNVFVDRGGNLQIKIEGPWLDTILYEVPLLAIINELYFRETSNLPEIQAEGSKRLLEKVEMLKKHPRLMLAEFGTRRRYSREWQEYVFGVLNDLPNVVGTSNVRLAMDNDTKPIGTMAHEYLCAHLGLVDNLGTAQKRALHVWLQEYGTNLGVALTDTFTTPAFFKDFGHVLANAFSGVRHDSGDPIKFGIDTIAHYESLGIDPRTKTIVFSDGLDIPEAIRIFETFTGLIGISFGVGTNLTNDLGPKALNIVIKLIECDDTYCVKLSDNPGKAIGNAKQIDNVREIYGAK